MRGGIGHASIIVVGARYELGFGGSAGSGVHGFSVRVILKRETLVPSLFNSPSTTWCACAGGSRWGRGRGRGSQGQG